MIASPEHLDSLNPYASPHDRLLADPELYLVGAIARPHSGGPCKLAFLVERSGRLLAGTAGELKTKDDLNSLFPVDEPTGDLVEQYPYSWYDRLDGFEGLTGRFPACTPEYLLIDRLMSLSKYTNDPLVWSESRSLRHDENPEPDYGNDVLGMQYSFWHAPTAIAVCALPVFVSGGFLHGLKRESGVGESDDRLERSKVWLCRGSVVPTALNGVVERLPTSVGDSIRSMYANLHIDRRATAALIRTHTECYLRATLPDREGDRKIEYRDEIQRMSFWQLVAKIEAEWSAQWGNVGGNGRTASVRSRLRAIQVAQIDRLVTIREIGNMVHEAVEPSEDEILAALKSYVLLQSKTEESKLGELFI